MQNTINFVPFWMILVEMTEIFIGVPQQVCGYYIFHKISKGHYELAP